MNYVYLYIYAVHNIPKYLPKKKICKVAERCKTQHIKTTRFFCQEVKSHQREKKGHRLGREEKNMEVNFMFRLAK